MRHHEDRAALTPCPASDAPQNATSVPSGETVGSAGLLLPGVELGDDAPVDLDDQQPLRFVRDLALQDEGAQVGG